MPIETNQDIQEIAIGDVIEFTGGRAIVFNKYKAGFMKEITFFETLYYKDNYITYKTFNEINLINNSDYKWKKASFKYKSAIEAMWDELKGE